MDGTRTVTLTSAVAARVRAARQERGWTLDRLATVAGLSRRMVVSVEQGAVNPSLETLLRLSEALGVGLPALVAPAAPHAVRVVRAGAAPVLWTGDRGGRGVLVAGTEPPEVVELWEWTLEPGERHASAPHRARTRELLQVREGEVVVEVAGESHALGTGDAVVFPGDVAHGYANPGAAPARFTLVVHEPGVGEEAPGA